MLHIASLCSSAFDRVGVQDIMPASKGSRSSSETGRELLANTDESTLAKPQSSPRIVPSPITRPPAAWNRHSFRGPLSYSPQASPQQAHSVHSPPIRQPSEHASPTPHTSKWKKWRKRLNPIQALKKVGVGLGLWIFGFVAYVLGFIKWIATGVVCVVCCPCLWYVGTRTW